MTAFPSYSTGTVAVAASATTVIGTSTIWTGVNARPGDDITIAGHIVQIVDVTDATHLVIDAWPYTTVTAGAAYKITQNSPLRFVGGQAMADVSTLVAALNTTGFYVFVSSTATVPDPSYGSDGQYAFQATTGKMWIKASGTWTFLGVFSGVGFLGAWSSSTAYTVNQIVSLAGSSYACILANTNQTPPNATYWTLSASVGSTGSTGATGASYAGTSTTSFLIGTGSKAFTTQAGLAWLPGARARVSSLAGGGANYMEGVVTAYSGTTLTVNVTKIVGSGTDADWQISLAGDPGSGDLLSTNNLSDVSNATTARSNLEAASFDALAHNNIVVNGGMEVDQVNAGASTTVATTYAIDGWIAAKVGTMVCAAQQVADAPAGFSNSLKITVGTAEASLGAGDYVEIFSAIEGFRTSKLQLGTAGALSFTLGFWTKIHRTGAYSGSIRNAALNRSYPFSFTQNVADTWEYKTVTIAGDTTGTWVGNTNGIGLYLTFSIACGTTNAGTANAWAATGYNGVTGTTNGVAATSDVFQVTGVCLLPGTVAATAARSPLTKRSFEHELMLCKRYLHVLLGSAVGSAFASGVCYSATLALAALTFPVQMRAVPTLSYSALTDFMVVIGAGTPTPSAVALTAPTSQSTRLDLTIAGGTAGQGCVVQAATSSLKVLFDARM